MRVTKLEHSGIVVEKDGKVLLCDPVEFTEKLPEFANVAAVVLTHQHGDHFQPEVLKRIWVGNLGMRVFVTPEMFDDVKTMAKELGSTVQENVVAVQEGDKKEAEGFSLEFFGKNHAAIVPGVVPCENVGVVIDEVVVNPGDSFDMPANIHDPELLLVPLAAPWCKIAESMDFVRAVRPKRVLPVHDAVLSDLGKGFNNAWLEKAVKEVGGELLVLKFGESAEV